MKPIEILMCVNLIIFDVDYPVAPEFSEMPKGMNGISKENALIIKREVDK